MPVLARAYVCQHWLGAWSLFDNNVPLPNSSYTPMPDAGGGQRVWTVTSDFGGAGTRTISGDAWCHTSNTGAGPAAHSTAGINCWCRMTLPNQGKWLYLYDYSGMNPVPPPSHCGMWCAHDCGRLARGDPAAASNHRMRLLE